MKRRHRGGYTLVEVMSVMGASAVLLTTVGTTLHLLFRTTSELREADVGQAMVERFGVRLQSDAHRAQRAEPTEEALTLYGLGWKAVYQRRGQDVVRSMIRDGRPPEVELYSLLDDHLVAWQLVESTGALLQVTLQPKEDTTAPMAPVAAREILVAVGLEGDE